MQFCKTLQEKRKPTWFNTKFKDAITKRIQGLKRFREIPTASKKTRLLKISQGINFTVIEVKSNFSSIVFSSLMNKSKIFFKTLDEKTSRKGVKTYLNNNQNLDNKTSPRVNGDMFYKTFVNFLTTVEGPTTQELEESIKKIDTNDDKLCAFTTNITEVLSKVGNLINNKAF